MGVNPLQLSDKRGMALRRPVWIDPPPPLEKLHGSNLALRSRVDKAMKDTCPETRPTGLLSRLTG